MIFVITITIIIIFTIIIIIFIIIIFIIIIIFLVIIIIILSIYCRSAEADASSNIQSRILSTFLNELDGIVGLVGASSSTDNSNSCTGTEDDGGGKGYHRYESRVLVIIACQNIDSLDEALIRPG